MVDTSTDDSIYKSARLTNRQLDKESPMKLHQLATQYGVDSIPQYIYASFLNGQHKQVLELIKECNQLEDYDDEDLMFDLTNHYLRDYIECNRFIELYFDRTVKETL